MWLSAPLLTLWIISTLVDHEVAKGFVNLNYDRALLETALDLGRNVREANNQLYIDLPKPIIEMLISGEQGRFLYRANGPQGQYISGDPDLPDPPSTSPRDRVVYYDATYQGQVLRAVAVRVPVRPGSGKGALLMQVAERAQIRNDSARQIMLRMMIPQGILILLASLTIWFGVGIGLRTLTSVRREIASRSHLDLSPIDERKLPPELQPLISSMNDLLSRLSAALAAQQRFIADAAHQLRTPVAALKTQTELAIRQVHDKEEHAAFKNLHSAADHAARLVSQLLTLARAESGSYRSMIRQAVNLVVLARQTASEWVPRALARELDIGFDDDSAAVTISVDPFLLREMLNNLIDNAICYTPAGGHITVRIRKSSNSAMIDVEDSGIGIPEAERDKVFERFYRIPGGTPEGCGLGLAIVREIAQGHDGTTEISQGAGGRGTRVTVSFPLSM